MVALGAVRLPRAPPRRSRLFFGRAPETPRFPAPRAVFWKKHVLTKEHFPPLTTALGSCSAIYRGPLVSRRTRADASSGPRRGGGHG